MNSYVQTGPSQYRGRGGRGGRPFRGGGRGQFNRGRGRGVGGGRHFPSHSSGPAISDGADVPAATGATSVVQPSSSVTGQTTSPKQAQVPAAPSQPPLPPPPKAWCEICKVGCNTLEVMEQHKSGKKHKKNMKAHEELERQKAINGQQSEQIPTTQLNLTDQPKKVQESEKNGGPAENMGSEVAAVNHKDETELQNNVGETSAVPAEEPEVKTGNNSAVKGRGLKRKMRGGRGSKLTRTADGSRRPPEPRKTDLFIPFKCELCNVKCESEVVYQSHVTGKKHLSNLKRAHGPQALSGILGLQSLYPPDINALSNAINAQVQQGDNDPQVLLAQLVMNVLSQAQVPAAAPTAGPVAAQIPGAPTSVAGSSYDPQLSQTQASEITAHVHAQADSNIGSQIAGGSSESNQQSLIHPQDSSVMTSADNSGAANDQIIPS